MAPKRTVDEGLLFLYSCFKHKSGDVDISAVCAENGDLKPGTARMRLYRLIQTIESAQQAEKGGLMDSTVGDKSSCSAKGMGKGNGGAGMSKGKKRKLSEAEDDVEEDSKGPVKVKVKDEEE